MLRSISTVLIVAALASPGHADALDQVAAPPPNFPANGVEVVEQLGASLPLDVLLRDHTGADVTLGQLLAGDIPTILTFNYSSCPNLCSLQLDGLVRSLPELVWRTGHQFRILTIVLDPTEAPDRVRSTRERYVGRLPQGSIAAAWTFATTRTPGDAKPIERIADAVGFRYQFITESAQWAHPAALIFVSSRGRVTRYVHGVDYAKDDMIESIARAGVDEPTAGVGFMMRCFHWDPTANDYSKMGASVLRYAAAGFLVIVLTAFGLWHLARRQRARALGDRP